MYTPTPRKVSDWLLQFKNIDTGLYNLEEVKKHQFDDDAPSALVLSYAEQDNNELHLKADMYNIGNTPDILVKRILENNLYRHVNEIRTRFRKMNEADQREVVRKLLAILDSVKPGVITNRILSGLSEMTVGDVFESPLAIENGDHSLQNAWYDVEPARKFASGDDVSWKPSEYFTSETEEYLASIGL